MPRPVIKLTWVQLHLFLRDLNPGRFSDRATASAAFLNLVTSVEMTFCLNSLSWFQPWFRSDLSTRWSSCSTWTSGTSASPPRSRSQHCKDNRSRKSVSKLCVELLRNIYLLDWLQDYKSIDNYSFVKQTTRSLLSWRWVDQAKLNA